MRNPMIDKASDVLQRGLEKAKSQGASAAKLGFRQSESIAASFENARLKKADTQQGLSVNVDVVVGRKRGSTSCTALGDVDEMVDRALALAAAGAAAHFDAYPPPAPTTEVNTYSARTAALKRQRMIEGEQTIVDALKGYNPDLYIEAGASRRETATLLVTSGGVVHRSAATGWSLNAWAQRTEGTDMLFTGFGRGWRDLNEYYDPNLIIEHMLEDLRNAEKIVPAPSGKTVALLSPEMLGMFLWAVQMGINGRNVAKGDSPLRGRVGEQVLDPCLTVVDDPHLNYSNGAADMSADGIPTRRTTLFDRGVLKTFLYDLDTAGLAGAEPTGHSGCSPYSPEVGPGERTHAELLKSIDDGIYIKQLMGFGQSNIINGDFSSNVALGFRIRGGEIAGRVKNTMVAGNVYELLRSGVRLSSDSDPIQRTPYAVIEGLSVSAAPGK